jgi:tripartite-type tricarboxylate transporter receptor subunit TctC
MKKVILLIMFLIVSSEVRAQTPYYQGKTITFIVGSGAGTAYDMYGRLLANYIGKHIPGNPSVIVQNMPAAGGLVASNYAYGVAKPDGLTIASINPAHYFNQIQGNKEVQFDWTKFTWLASSDKSEHMLYMRTDAPYKTNRMFVKHLNRPNAAPPAREPAVIISRACLKKPLAPSLRL